MLAVAERSQKSKGDWKCPECGMEVSVYVAVSEPPTCKNPEVHSSRVVQMVKAK